MNDRKDDYVLFLSGGLDSYTLFRVYKPKTNLFFITGTQDNANEFSYFNNLKTIYASKDLDFVTVNFEFLKEFELPNKIIPLRNAYFVLVGMNYGNNVLLGATKGDSTKDKDYVFASMIEALVNYFALDTNKISPNLLAPFKVTMPFKDLTKSKIVELGLNSGITKQEYRTETRSCYSAGNQECGVCRSCLRKAIAFCLNDIDYRDVFEVDPFSLPFDEKQLHRFGEGEEYYSALQKLNLL